MKTTMGMIFLALGGLLLGGTVLAADPIPDGQASQAQRDGLYKTMDQGNFKDAYDGLRKIILEPGQPMGEDLSRAVTCLQRLNRTNEIDELLESAVKAQQDAPRTWLVPLGRGSAIHASAQAGLHRGGQILSRPEPRRRRPAGQYARPATASGRCN